MRAIDIRDIDIPEQDADYDELADFADKIAVLATDAIEVEPVRRGRWVLEDIPYTEWYRITCSECGEDVTSTAPCIGGAVIWDYCPNCGANMRSEKDG